MTQKEAGTKLLKDFAKAYESGTGEAPKLIEELKHDVMKFATSFPMPGVPDTVSQCGNHMMHRLMHDAVYDQKASWRQTLDASPQRMKGEQWRLTQRSDSVI